MLFYRSNDTQWYVDSLEKFYPILAISQHRLKIYYSIASLIVRESLSLSILILIMFSRISHRMDAVKQVNSGERARFSFLEEKSRKFWITKLHWELGQNPRKSVGASGQKWPIWCSQWGNHKKEGEIWVDWNVFRMFLRSRSSAGRIC